MIIDSENFPKFWKFSEFSKFSKQEMEDIGMEIKEIKAEYRMQEMHKMIQSRAESDLTVNK